MNKADDRIADHGISDGVEEGVMKIDNEKDGDNRAGSTEEAIEDVDEGCAEGDRGEAFWC